MKTESHLATLVRSVFPPDMEVTRIDLSTSEAVFRVGKLYSRKIRVFFGEDVLEDYQDPRNGVREQMDTFIRAYLSWRWKQHVDDGVLDPPVDWIVDTDVYFPEPLLPAASR